uniref:Uncharacterized protein n=1 Tax=Anguilla anguilla TaxID=7936 RepID=A0A0E9VN34_ANGAN
MAGGPCGKGNYIVFLTSVKAGLKFFCEVVED